MQLLIIRVNSVQSGWCRTTSSLLCFVRVKVFEYQDITMALLAHEIELLPIIVFDIHGRACVVSADVVGLNEVG